MPQSVQIDDIDRRILRTLAADGRVSNARLAQIVGLSASPCWQRVKRLEDNGITKTTAIGSSVKFGLLAAGEADVYPRFGPTMEWDTAAGDAVLRAAGGRLAFINGSEFTYGKPDYRNPPFVAYAGYTDGLS